MRTEYFWHVCTEPRVYHFSTHGLGMAYFNSSGLSYVEEEILPYLKENDYYTAFTVYADRAEELLQMASEGEPYDESQSSGLYTLCVIAGALASAAYNCICGYALQAESDEHCRKRRFCGKLHKQKQL